ncbi:MAG: adenine deaminase [Bacteroidetes bacterium RIFOXYA12_FULL_35_11]|nr:MAG: adenine deaminase [Bacteroidetes bacterium GWF2_35_48]OFY75250.1 MAG: adenine deaminase [Bacteroidetes bacterium RIFOXYA12_FULL_35_11]OFY96927.1 MAG: adenine deaminase [Bacteroidetes bacterium RIFOXYB2_FULL_35_7]OFY97726.1 MAG: adenine deaminase [Bacteroidetes bacterium RIFOXYC12_FULL_35_7]
MNIIFGKIVDVINRSIYDGEILYENGMIVEIRKTDRQYDNYILPGLIDSHVHIESSMLTPQQFGKLIVSRGTVATVSDPHEIANVLGIYGINYMIDNAKLSPLKFFFGVPSCVPATAFETAGSAVTSLDVADFLERREIVGLSEMMNYPGVIYNDTEVLLKIKSAIALGKPIDGHAPGLKGEDLKKYVSEGISTDHECSSLEEAIEKIKLGMTIQIREGSAAKNFIALYKLIDLYPDQVMICTDDSHPEDIIQEGHLDKIVKMGIEKGLDIFNLLKAVSVNPVLHYNLEVGLLRQGDPADFIVVDDLKNFNVLQTYINGNKLYDKGKLHFKLRGFPIEINNFKREDIHLSEIKVKALSEKIRVIEVEDGELLTKCGIYQAKIENGYVVSDTENDILKIVVLNRYDNESKPAVGFIKNIGLKTGALGTSIAHDSHNLIVVGTNDIDIVNCFQALIENKGGLVTCSGNTIYNLPLEVAGLMTNKDPNQVAEKYNLLKNKAHEYGSSLKAPFMTLAFMSLLVIPELKLGDKGLFDVNKFEFTELFV